MKIINNLNWHYLSIFDIDVDGGVHTGRNSRFDMHTHAQSHERTARVSALDIIMDPLLGGRSILCN